MESLIAGRLNGDATWWVEHAGLRVLFDPWLLGSEIDFAPWFNQAWHVDPVIAPDDAGPFDLVVLSQPFADHHHPATLAALAGEPILAAVPGCRTDAAPIPPLEAEPLCVGGLRIWRLTRPWYHPPRYHAVIVVDAEDRAVVHAPHGLPAEPARLIAERFDVELVAISRARYQLPFFLGGAVNPGNDAAVATVRALGARTALAIHDEPKRSEGLVRRLAFTERGPYPDDGIPWLDLPIEPPSKRT